jgi:hypothetical protein
MSTPSRESRVNLVKKIKADIISASARISKGQGYQGVRLKEKGREQFWPEKGNLRRTRKNLKNGQNFTTFRVNKMFSHKTL